MAQAAPVKQGATVTAPSPATVAIIPASDAAKFRQTGIGQDGIVQPTIIPPEGGSSGPQAGLRWTRKYVGLKWKAKPDAYSYRVQVGRLGGAQKTFSVFSRPLPGATPPTYLNIAYRNLPSPGRNRHGGYWFRVTSLDIWNRPIKGRVTMSAAKITHKTWINRKTDKFWKSKAGRVAAECNKQAAGVATAITVGGGIAMGLSVVFPPAEPVTAGGVAFTLATVVPGEWVGCVVYQNL